MNSTYAQKSSTVQKAADTKAASVIDSSAQNESLQRKADMANNAAQRAEAPRPNNTGMPDNLKSGIESLSGFSMDDVRVHYNSSKPATVQALAYTQGTDIHVAPGQEKCLPHEAWHVAQQMAGRVSPTTNINGMPVNDNAALEHEADVMGEKAVTQRISESSISNCKNMNVSDSVAQCVVLPHIKVIDPIETLPKLPFVNGDPVYPHIAFESLAGGSRVGELSELYNNVISPYKGLASVYMGVNACRYKYEKYEYYEGSEKKSGLMVSERKNGEAEADVENAVKDVKSKIVNKKRNHSITLIPFIWDMVGLGKHSDKKCDLDIAKESLKQKKKTEDRGTVKKDRKADRKAGKAKKEKTPIAGDQNLHMWQKESVAESDKTFRKASMFDDSKKEFVFPKADSYVFPFYEARSLIMEKASSSQADLYRWIDSDVRNDSSIGKIDRTYAETKMGCGKEDAVVSSGCYKWRANDDGNWQKNVRSDNPRLKPYFDTLNLYEHLFRRFFWKSLNGESKMGPFTKEVGYIPEPIVYMNSEAHKQACGNLKTEIDDRANPKSESDPDAKQDRESDIAFNKMFHAFIDEFEVSKPVKDYFDEIGPEDLDTKKLFRSKIIGARQTAFRNWNLDAAGMKEKVEKIKGHLLEAAWQEYRNKTQLEDVKASSIAEIIEEMFLKNVEVGDIIKFINVSPEHKQIFLDNLLEYSVYGERFRNVLAKVKKPKNFVLPSITEIIEEKFLKNVAVKDIIAFITENESRKRAFMGNLSEYSVYGERFQKVYAGLKETDELNEVESPSIIENIEGLFKNKSVDVGDVVAFISTSAEYKQAFLGNLSEYSNSEVRFKDVFTELMKKNAFNGVVSSIEMIEEIVKCSSKCKIELEYVLEFLKQQNLSVDPVLEKVYFAYNTEDAGKGGDSALNGLYETGVDFLCKAHAPVVLINEAISRFDLTKIGDSDDKKQNFIRILIGKMFSCGYTLESLAEVLLPIKGKMKGANKALFVNVLKEYGLDDNAQKPFFKIVFPVVGSSGT